MQNSTTPQNKALKNSAQKHWIESGNEMDPNSSTETLSIEQQHAMWHMQRQEPQGQEQNHGAQSTVITVGGPDLGSVSSTARRNNDSNLSFGSSTNTLIIHHSVPDESWSNRWLAGYSSHNMTQNSSPMIHNSYNDVSKSPFSSSYYLRGNTNNLQDSALDISSRNVKLNSSTELKKIPTSYLDKSEILKHLVPNDQNKYSDVSKKISQNFSKDTINSMGGNLGLSDQSTSSSSSGINITPGDLVTVMPRTSPQYHNPSPMMNRMPPPYYSHFQQEKYDHRESDFYNGRRSVDKNTSTLSKSQPDLSNVGISKELTPTKDHRLLPLYSDDESTNSLKEMIDILSNENHTLKMEIDYFHRKITKLQKFEAEMVKVEEQHEALVKMGERREQLERLARHKLHCEVRRLTELNSELKEQLKERSYADIKSQVDVGINRASSLPDDSSENASLKKELGRKDTIISQLVSQNRELTTANCEMEKETLNKNKKIKEEQKQIDILDSALTSTQTTVLKLEEKVKKNQNSSDQVEQLRNLLLSMQRTSNRVDQIERNTKQKLEDEINILRSKNKVDATTVEILDMRAELRTKDEKMLLLETEMSKLKQKIMYEAFKNNESMGNLKEYAMEVPQYEIERRISQTKVDHIRTSDEYKQLHKRMEELKLSNRSLEAVIAERDAKIKALNKKADEAQLNQSNLALNLSTHEDKNSQLRREHSVGANSSIRNIPRKDEEMVSDEFSLLSLLSNLSLVTKDCDKSVQPEAVFESSQNPYKDSRDIFNNIESFCRNPKNKQFMMNLLESKETLGIDLSSKDFTSLICNDVQRQSNTSMSDEYVTVIAEKESAAAICVNENPSKENADNGQIKVECSEENRNVSNVDKQIEILNDIFNGSAPPPYHGHHQILKDDLINPQTGALNVDACSHKKHGSNIFCRSCQNIRRSARQVPLVRRANSSACHQNRRSVPSPSSSLDSLEDAPSILERLKKEWELGMLSGPSKESTLDGSKTLPYPLATVMNLSQSDDSEPTSANTRKELKQFSDEMSNLIESKNNSLNKKQTSDKKISDKNVELKITEDFDEKMSNN